MNKITYYFIFIFIGTVFFLMNNSTPLRCDDLVYQFQWLGTRDSGALEPIDLSHKVSDLYDALISQINHYQVMNGRFLIHFIVQCFCGFLGKSSFNICNTIVYILFIYGCILLMEIKTNHKIIFAICIIWLGLPIQYIFYYSISFAINYLWTSTALIYFLILIRSESNIPKSNTSKIFILLTISFLFGSLHEGFSVPLSGVLFLHLLYTRKQLMPSFVAITIGLIMGTVILLLSPGTIGRGTNSLSNISLQELFVMKLEILRYSKRLLLFISVILIFYLFQRNIAKEFIKKRGLEIGFILLDLGFVIAVPHYSQRIEFPLEMLSLLLSIELIMKGSFWNIKKIRTGVTLAILPIFIFHMAATLYYTRLVNKEYQVMLQEYSNSPQGVTHYQELYIPKPLNPYVKRLDSDVEREYISFVMGKDMIIEN